MISNRHVVVIFIVTRDDRTTGKTVRHARFRRYRTQIAAGVIDGEALRHRVFTRAALADLVTLGPSPDVGRLERAENGSSDPPKSRLGSYTLPSNLTTLRVVRRRRQSGLVETNDKAEVSAWLEAVSEQLDQNVESQTPVDLTQPQEGSLPPRRRSPT